MDIGSYRGRYMRLMELCEAVRAIGRKWATMEGHGKLDLAKMIQASSVAVDTMDLFMSIALEAATEEEGGIEDETCWRGGP